MSPSSNHSPRLTRKTIIKLGRLLDMMYRPSEIAAELGISVDTIYRAWLPAGLPHKRDRDKNIWIHGPALAAWARETVAQRKHPHPLGPGQGWCMKCNAPVAMHNPKIIYQNRYIEIVQSPCQNCGTPVNRARKRRATNDTSPELP